jgi:hypothetical protein
MLYSVSGTFLPGGFVFYAMRLAQRLINLAQVLLHY